MSIFSSDSSSSNSQLKGVRVAILATEGVEEKELTEPQKALKEAGADVKVVSPKSGSIKSWDMTDWGKKIDVDMELKNANPSQFDALVLPGGAMNPDKLRQMPEAVQFVRSFFTEGKPVGAICHAPWELIEADVVRGKTLTSWPSLKTDLRNAGANWVDQECVRDGNLVTSRKPDDLPAFNRTLIQLFAQHAQPLSKAS